MSGSDTESEVTRITDGSELCHVIWTWQNAWCECL